MEHEHKYGWVGGGIGDKVWKVDICPCGDIRDVRVKEMNPKQPFTDPMQKYYNQMFRCFDAVTAKYPDMAESSRKEMAVSLFIQTGSRV